MRVPIPHDGTATDVLVIDDNPQIREALGLLLTEAGYRVTVAPDARDGLRLFAQDRFQVVVSDVDMPGMDGWGVAHAVRLASPGVGVVLMSAYFDPQGVDAGRSGGLVTLAKPFPLEELIEIIDRVAAPGEESDRAGR